MKIREVNKILQDKTMQNQDCNFKLVKRSTSKLDLILQRLDKIECDMHNGFAQVNYRIDNLVKLNNLKEK